jgi:DNA-binding response OmpR family regulator
VSPPTVRYMGPADESAYTVLVVTARPELGSFLTDGLRGQGHGASWVRTPAATEIALRVAQYDVLLVEPSPDEDAAGVVRAVRSGAPDALVLIITAGESDPDVIAGLAAGADDYVSRPVNLSVLLARLRAHLRRAAAGRTGRGVALAIDDLVVDPDSRRCHIGSREVTLRAKEFDLLWMLVQHNGSVVTRVDLMSEVWDENWSRSTKVLDVTMAGLRRHLREVAFAEGAVIPPITTMRGHGYRIDACRAEVEAG